MRMGQHDWLITAFPKTVCTVFDTETTGLEPKTNRIVEAGAIRFDKRGVIARFNTLINPQMPMPKEASKINGISDLMLSDQPTASIAIPDFLRFIGTTVLVAHNAPFDVKFINAELLRLGLSPLANTIVDTLVFAKEVFPGLPRYSLQELAKHFRIEAVDAHRAEDDARVCMELFIVCLNRLRELKPDLNTEEETQPDIHSREKIDLQRYSKDIEEENYLEDIFLDDAND